MHIDLHVFRDRHFVVKLLERKFSATVKRERRRWFELGKAVGHNIHLAGLIVGLLHSVAGCREGEAAGDHETPGTTAQGAESRQAEVGGHYFGVRVLEPVGMRQSDWLHLDTDSLGGAIYDSRRLLRVCALRIASAGAVAFSTGEDFGTGRSARSFEGRFDADGLRGRLRVFGRDFGEVVFDRFAEAPDSLHRLTGVYSNIVLVERAGDLVGREVIIAADGDELRVMYDAREGASVPHAGFNVSFVEDTLRFEIIVADGSTRRYVGILRDNGLDFFRESRPEASETLPKRFTLEEFFDQERHGDCE